MFFIHPFRFLIVILPVIFAIVMLNTLEYKEKLGLLGTTCVIALCLAHSRATFA
jgi:hypothetical protein